MAFPRAGAKALRPRLAAALTGLPPSTQARWRPVLALIDAWTDGASLLSLQAPAVWLEFDDACGEDAATRFPSVSVCLTPGYDTKRAPFPNQPQLELRLIDEILTLLEVPREQRHPELFAECYRRLPAGARWIHLSVMLGRASADLKLYGALPRATLVPYLEAVGWAGDGAELRRLLAEAYPASLTGDLAFVDLNLRTLRDPTHATLGLAVAQQHLAHGPERDPLRTELLERWCSAGLADAAKVARIRDLLAVGPAAAEAATPRAGRFLDLKLVWSAELGTFTKAYLGFHRQPAELPWRASLSEELARLGDERGRHAAAELTALEALR
jgi:hypothetical protein